MLGLIVITAVALAACQKTSRDRLLMEGQFAQVAERDQAKDISKVQVAAGAPAAEAASAAADPLAAMFAARKLIRHAQVSLEVASFGDAAREILRLAEVQGGYVAESSASSPGDGIHAGYLVIRVPGERFTRALESVRKVGKIRAETVSTEDVSRAYADLETRLRVKRDAASRLREILRSRTGKLTDILEVEQALTSVVEEIEQMEGQRRFYDNQVALSTIRLDISEPAPIVRRGVLAPVSDALRESVRMLVGSLATLVALSVAALPWALLLIVLLALVRRALRRRASRRQASAAA
jgi:hypothetical protein